MSHLQRKIKAFHNEENGAVFLLLLAAFLILFMVAITLFDTGIASSDKVSVQISSDTASYSHAVVKARSMNVIVYANIIKRMYFSYKATYVNAWTSLITGVVTAGAICFFSAGTAAPACAETKLLAKIIIAETQESIKTNSDTVAAFKDEIEGLEQYQNYMTAITPWWAFIESLIRGSNNGGLLSVTWPPPPTALDEIKQVAYGLAGASDSIAGTQLMNQLPPLSSHVDALPIARRDLAGNNNGIIDYCQEYLGSWEHLIPGLQTVISLLKQRTSLGLPPIIYITEFLLLEVLNVVGCGAAAYSYGPQYLDHRILDSLVEDKGKWAQATSNISVAYRPRAGRNDDEKGRKKYGYLKSDYSRNITYTNEGYYALSRSEIVYSPIFKSESFSISNGKLASILRSLTESPDMWSPRWKARGRPLLVPGEELGSSLPGAPATLGTVLFDSVPLILITSLTGLFSDKFSIGSALHDLFYLVHVGKSGSGSGFNGTNIQGIPK